jgi:actin-related protein
MGANTVHELAIVDGKTDYSSIRRINIGGNQSFELFAKTLLLKNPQLKTKLTYGFLRDIYEKFTSVAIDYKEQLRYFSKKYKMQNNIIYRNRIV